MRMFSKVSIVFLAWVAIVAPIAAQDRSLYWDALTVHAQLDAQGALHISERHAMVFNGAWNGGERVFQLRNWQSLSLRGLSEIDPGTQSVTPLRGGDLDEVGEYRLDNRVLRWRTRLPNDPPFENALRVYEITYVLEGALVPVDGQYRLEHNLAFPDRSGVIRTFDATLEIDPAWAGEGIPTTWHEENLQPGQSVFVNAMLRYVGAGRPSAVAAERIIPSATGAPVLRYGLLIVIIAFVVVHVVTFMKREKLGGRFDPALPLDQIDERWLRENVFDRPPEVVGAAWDFDTSESEVSALLARLTQQRALKTEVRSSGSGWFKRDILHMELLCDRDRLADHERELIDALFFGGSRTTDTDKIQKHYSKRGFTPSSVIKQGIEAQLPMIFANKLAVPLWTKLLTVALFIAGFVSVIVGAGKAPDAAGPLLACALFLFVSFIFAIVFAYRYRVSVYDLRGKLMRTLIVLSTMYVLVAFVMLSGRVSMVAFGLIGLTLQTLAYMNSVFNMMRIREREESRELRRKLATARAYFEQELKSPQPRLQDDWFPYLLAFGLGPKIDRWFKSIAPQSSRARVDSGTTLGGSSGSSISSASSPSWTGGGGTFGGAGASGAWAAAVGGIAAGVSQPSSGSSGSSSGGGSSSSSGGGGGGGW